ncbi:MAG: rRNA adenine N-6-methyltransferase family protein [Patescibacteria group bacterium]
MATQSEMKQILEAYGTQPNERLGQNFLIDETIINIMASQARGVHVIEIGAGIGQLTAAIAARSQDVTALEIDQRYEPFLSQVQSRYGNVNVQYCDVLHTGIGQFIDQRNYTQVISSLPFHITEPMIWGLVDRAILDAVLLIGDNAAEALITREDSSYYGRMSFIAQTFFAIEHLYSVSRESFYPVPRTDAAIVRLTPKDRETISASTSNTIFANLVRTAVHSPLVINVIKDTIMSGRGRQGTLDKKESSQRDRSVVKRQTKSWAQEWNRSREIDLSGDGESSFAAGQQYALSIITKMGLDKDLLTKPFVGLDNPDIKRLVRGVRSVLS